MTPCQQIATVGVLNCGLKRWPRPPRSNDPANASSFGAPSAPHQGVGTVQLVDGDNHQPSVVMVPSSAVRCRDRIGALLRHYYTNLA